jgi:putative SOS response-associated peptidase YedK
MAEVDAWVNGTAGTELLKPAADDALRVWPVSRRVNRTRDGDDDPGLIEEIELHA